MKHYLTYKENKFWNIEISGKSFTLTYGETVDSQKCAITLDILNKSGKS